VKAETVPAVHDPRPGETWAIEAPDNRATWRPVRVIELTTRNRAVVELLNGPHKGEQIKVRLVTFIRQEVTQWGS
jgi:hypothetical protein